MPTGGWSGYWQRQFGTAHSLLQKYPNALVGFEKSFKGVTGSKYKRIVTALTGAAVGQDKSLSRKRVKSEQAVGQAVIHGGVVPIETQTLLTGNTDSTDLATIDNALAIKNKPASYPSNASGWKAGNPGSLT